VIGIGTDLVEVDRFRSALDRTPGLAARVFTEGELAYAALRRDPTSGWRPGSRPRRRS
jgi:holo-[acyl-carrier protein] synthase